MRSGQFLKPSLVLDPRPESRIVTEEQFGPTLPIIQFDDEPDAIRQANDTWSGLCSSVWSADAEHADAVAHSTSVTDQLTESAAQFGVSPSSSPSRSMAGPT